MDRILKEDIGYLANSNMIDWKELTGKSVFITGGTGLIGSQLALTLAEYDKLHNAGIKIYVLARNQEKAEKIFKDYKEYVCVVFGNVRNKIVVDENIDYIIHGASITGSKEFVDFPVETIYTGIDGTKNVLEFAKEKKIKVMVLQIRIKRVFRNMSMAILNRCFQEAAILRENEWQNVYVLLMDMNMEYL